MAEQTEAELQYAYRCRVVDTVGATIQTAIPWLGMTAIAGFLYLSVDSLAGKHTFADIGMAILSDIKISEMVAYILGGGGVLYGIKYRRLKGDNVQRTADRIAELEKRLDPNRSSSRLTSRGETRPGD